MISVMHNMAAQNMQRQLKISTKDLGKAAEALSSGYRINRAADDAAGLSVSEKMREQIRGLNKASGNIQDGNSYVQVADGALEQVNEMLCRINELAIQAANDTNTIADRSAINLEIQQIKAEMGRIFSDTEFNGRKIWKGPEGIDIPVENTHTYPAVVFDAVNTTSTITNTNKDAVPSGSYSLAADEKGIIVSWKAYNGKSYSSEPIPWDSKIQGAHSFNLADYLDTQTYPELQGLDFKYSYTVNDHSTLDDVIKAINKQTVYAYVSKSEYAKAYGVSGNVSGLSFSTNIDYVALLASGKDFENSDTDFIEAIKNGSNAYDNITVNPMQPGKASSPWEFTFDMPDIGKVTAKPISCSYHGSTAEPDNGVWWKWVTPTYMQPYKSTILYTPSPSNGSYASVENALKNNTAHSLTDKSEFGGSITISFSLNSENEYSYQDSAKKKSVGSMSMAISVSSTDTVESVKKRLQNLQAVDIYDNSQPTTTNAYKSKYNSANTVSVSENGMETVYGDEIGLKIQTSNIPFDHIDIVYEELSNKILGLENTNTLTVEDAGKAIGECAIAMEAVSAQRSLFGSYQNRLEHAKNVAENSAENTTAAESRIRDTEIARLMVYFSERSILQQAGESLLAQANQNPQKTVELLLT